MKYLLLVLCLGLLSLESYASRSRLKGLSQEIEKGPYYVSDSFNKFVNPAYLNIYSDYVVTEWGRANNGHEKENAEGGFFASDNNFSYGIYLGHENSSRNKLKSELGFLKEDNRFDIFLSGDAGIEWGISLGYSSNDNKQGSFDKSGENLDVSFGVISGGLDLYLKSELLDKASGANLKTDDWKSSIGVELGGKYSIGGMSAVFIYETKNNKVKANSIDYDYEYGRYALGVGRIYDIDRHDKVFADIFLDYYSEKMGSLVDKKVYNIPVTIGFEGQLKDWLTLRGAIEQSILGKEKDKTGKSKSLSENTKISSGLGISLKKVNLDGYISKSNETITGVSAKYSF